MKLDKELIAALTIDALTQRCKSPASARNVWKNVSGLIQFPLKTRDESNPTGVMLTEGSSVALLRDYLQMAAKRGRTVPGAVKSPPSA